MLEDIRQGAKGPMGKVLVVVISLAFGLWGVSTVVPLVFGGGAPVTVNGERVTEAEIAQRLFQERQRIIEQFGGQIDQSFLRDEFIRPQVINQLVTQRLISQAAEQHQFVLSDESLNRILARQVAFQEQGRFSPEVFSRIAARQGMTATQLRDQMGANELAEQWVNGLLMSEFVLESEIELYGRYLHQLRSVDYITFAPVDFVDQINISSQAVQSFYVQQSDRFQTPERTSVAYIRLTRDQLLPNWSPTSEDLDAAYARYREQQLSQRDQFVSHILITLDSRSDDEALALAQTLRSRAENENFANLAETYSDDPGSANEGGALGRYDPEVFLPEFASVMSGLNASGDLSEVFSTAFGYHIVKLDTATTAPVESFADMRGLLTDQVADRYIAARLPVIREELAALAFSGLDLDPIQDAFDVAVAQSPMFDRSGTGWSLASSELVSAAFSSQVLNDDLNSDVLTLDDGSLVVLRKERFEPAAVQPFAEVESDIRQILVDEAAQELAESSAQQIKSEIDSNLHWSADWQELVALTRFDESLPGSIVDAIFRAKEPESSSSPTPFIASSQEGLWVVGRVKEVISGNPKEDEAEIISSFLRNELSTDGIDGLLNHLQSNAKIRIR